MNHTEPDVEELTTVANKFYDEAQSAAAGMLEAAWRSGQALVKIKAMLKHGKWMSWTANNFHGSHDTANQYMLLASNYDSYQNLGEHDSIISALKAIRAAKPKKKPKPAAQPKPAPKADNPIVADTINEMEDQGKDYSARDVVEKVAAQGVQVSVDTVERKRKAVREARSAAPVADWNSIPDSAKVKINREVERQYKRLAAQLKSQQEEEIKKRVEVLVKMQREALTVKEVRVKHILESHKGVVTQDEYNLIRSCLHPDSRASVTDEKLAAAFRVFNTDLMKAALVKGDK